MTSAWTSTSRGRVPSIIDVTTEPALVSARSSSRSSEGFETSTIPDPSIVNMPISSTGPNRFFNARNMRVCPERSPSITNNASMRCSSVFGPATPPSLLT